VKQFTLQSGCRGGEYPCKRQDSEHLRLRCFPMPAAIGIGAGKVFVPEHLHRFDFRQRAIRASLLNVDVVPALRAFKYDSIG
jgi:hypothetical protein